MSLALGALAIQGGLGLGQLIGGLVKKKPIIPEAEIPQEIYENMTDAEYWSYVGMPEAQKQQYIDNITRSGASALGNIQSRKGGLGAVSQIAQNETDAYRDLLSMDENRRFQNQQMLYGARERMAAEKARVDDINRSIKLDERDRRDQLIGSGLQNMMNTAGTLGTVSSFFPEMTAGLKGLFGKKGKALPEDTRWADDSRAVAESLGLTNQISSMPSLSDPYGGMMSNAGFRNKRSL
jgi:hypothetical protein